MVRVLTLRFKQIHTTLGYLFSSQHTKKKLVTVMDFNTHSRILTCLHLLITLCLVKQKSAMIDDTVSDLICTTPGCKSAAKIISNNINEKINPCENFYQFACGGFTKHVKIPKTRLSVSRTDALEEKVMKDLKKILTENIKSDEPRIFELVKNYYKACMDELTIDNLGLRPLENIINQLGGWPVLVGDSWDENKFDWVDTLIKLRRLGFPQKYLINTFVFNNLYNSSKNVLAINDGEQILDVVSLINGIGDDSYDAYYNYTVEVAVLLGADPKRASIELKEAMDFQAQLATIANPNFAFFAANIVIKTIEDLITQVPDIPWLSYLNNITAPFEKLDTSRNVIVDKPYYLYNLQWVLQGASKRTIANYLIWRAIHDSVPYLSENIRRKYINLNKKRNKRNGKMEPRYKQCINQLTDKDGGLRVGVSALYVRRYFDNSTRKDIRDIIYSIADQFQNYINATTWLDNQTKQGALRKSKLMRQIVGYPDEFLNDEKLDFYSSSLIIHPKSNLQNFLNLNRFNYDYSLTGLKESNDKRMWVTFSDSTEVNAYYYSLANTFVILAALLQPPIFSHDWPSYAKYGSAGFIIGHEMMHAFDTGMFLFDETGGLNQWYTDQSANKYATLIECYIKQYQNFSDKQLQLHVDGELTLDENLADNVGLHVAYSSYKKWTEQNKKEFRLPGLKYTPDQIFWISSVNFLCSKSTEDFRKIMLLTEKHAPNNFRALGMMFNSQDFSKAFNCPLDSPMNPKNKCSLV